LLATEQADLIDVTQGLRHDAVGLILLTVSRLQVEQKFDDRLLVRDLVESVVTIMRRLAS
jgi:hypothetical protein